MKDRADSRPRVHIWPHGDSAAWSTGPNGRRTMRASPGAALDDAIASVDVRGGLVVILEPAP